jgi:hypothetical protein
MTNEIQVVAPEPVWPVDPEYAGYYAAGVEAGKGVAAETDACIVAICRHAMPALPNTLLLTAALRRYFRSCPLFIFENDSEDGTAEVLDSVAAGHDWFHVCHESLGGIDSRGFEPERTERLAYCRNKCLEWVRENAANTSWTIVLDTDPAGGYSVDGALNSVGRLSEKMASGSPAGMASYSLYRTAEGIAHYDAWAARPVCWWRDRREEIGFNWFSAFLPPVGAPPCPMNSAFGGLAVYSTRAFLAGGYSGEDCEHVGHHRRMAEAGYQMWLNPGCRYIAIWEQ